METECIYSNIFNLHFQKSSYRLGFIVKDINVHCLFHTIIIWRVTKKARPSIYGQLGLRSAPTKHDIFKSIVPLPYQRLNVTLQCFVEYSYTIVNVDLLLWI